MMAVLVSARIDPISGRPTALDGDARAVALALALDAQTRLLHVGAMPEAAAREYLAQGAASLHSVAGEAALALELAGCALVLTGSRADHGSGLMPYRVAARLGWPLVVDVVAIEADGGGWLLTQALPKGRRRHLRLQGPGVIAISPKAPAASRHAHALGLAGRVSAAPGPTPEAPAPDGERVPAARQLQPLKAPERRSGHARMQAALGAVASPRATALQAGTPEDKARAVLVHLQQHGLISF